MKIRLFRSSCRRALQDMYPRPYSRRCFQNGAVFQPPDLWWNKPPRRKERRLRVAPRYAKSHPHQKIRQPAHTDPADAYKEHSLNLFPEFSPHAPNICRIMPKMSENLESFEKFSKIFKFFLKVY